MKSYIYSFSFCFCILFFHGKTKSQGLENTYRLNARMDISVPHLIGNPALKKSFKGSYDLNASLNAQPFKGFFAGFAFKHGQFKSDNKIVQGADTIPPNYLMYNVGVKTGYSSYLTESAVFSASVVYGYSFITYNHLPCTYEKLHLNAPYLEPGLNLFFYVEDNFAIGANLAYNILFHEFNPEDACLQKYRTYAPEDKNGYTQYLTIGFGLVYDFWKK